MPQSLRNWGSGNLRRLGGKSELQEGVWLEVVQEQSDPRNAFPFATLLGVRHSLGAAEEKAGKLGNPVHIVIPPPALPLLQAPLKC